MGVGIATRPVPPPSAFTGHLEYKAGSSDTAGEPSEPRCQKLAVRLSDDGMGVIKTGLEVRCHSAAPRKAARGGCAEARSRFGLSPRGLERRCRDLSRGRGRHRTRSYGLAYRGRRACPHLCECLVVWWRIGRNGGLRVGARNGHLRPCLVPLSPRHGMGRATTDS
jgi:hypothetical protein